MNLPGAGAPWLLVVFHAALAWQAPVAAGATSLPEGPGLAAQYPGDAGITGAPEVLLAEGFEAGELPEILRRWDSASDRGARVLSLSDDVPFPDATAGRHSLKITAHPGKDDGGHLYTRLSRGVETAFVRFYVKFPEPAGYVHHFVHVGGYLPETRWPQGGAGERPRGDDRFTVGIEPFGQEGRMPPPGLWNLYTYWHEMKRSADGRYWGNALTPAAPQPAPAGRWQCVELMIRLNTPGRRDGELALWLDGHLVTHIRQGTSRGPWSGLGFQVRDVGGEPFEGFDFRTTADLKVNFLWLLHYVTETSQRRNRIEDPARSVSVLFDHVVVATRYIGPVQPPSRRGAAKSS
jgi:hypothetical protein